MPRRWISIRRRTPLWAVPPLSSICWQDCCRTYGGVEPMDLAEGDVVRTRIDGRTLVLRDRQIEWLDN